MDKTAIKNYAVAARRKLIEAVRQKAYQLYIFEDGALPPDEAYHKLRSDGIFMTPEQSRARERLCSYLTLLDNEMDNEKAYQHVMEEVAYTWFNRLIALRFMEINDYLPSGIRILSSRDEGRAEPDAMREAERLTYVNQDKIAEYRAATGIDASEKLYKYILISQCNALSDILPGMFEKIDDYTELLLPDVLYRKGGIVHDLVHAIDEDDFRDQVQIIGWLYQYYISEKKDEVFAGLKKNIKINKETIPAATQLFTPEWIVKYMVENSLGRVLVDSGQWTVDGIKALKSNWKYYIEEAEQTDEVRQQLLTNHCSLSTDFHIFNVKIIDPCMGSGHILVYAFDVLYQIYFNQGYAEREIPNIILQNNIYGLDIDGRAAQLAYFALMMKARSYNRRFFRQESIPQPHVHAVIESDGAQQHHLDYMGHGMSEAERQACKDELAWLISLFADAREYGSILKINRALDYDRLRRFVRDVPYGQLDMYTGGIDQTERILLEILSIAEIMTQKYDVVVTNPPYMGSSSMGGKLSEYVKEHYPNSKGDLFAVFIEQGLQWAKTGAYSCMVTMQSWMFLSSFEKLRKHILTQKTIAALMHMENMVMGIAFGTAVSVIRNVRIPGYKGTYNLIKLSDINDDGVPFEFPVKANRFAQVNTENFAKIPGMPVAYWASESMINNYVHSSLMEQIAMPRQGMATCDNNRFLRLWYEVEKQKCYFTCASNEECKSLREKWFPYNKGGDFRNWYGNNISLINWEDEGRKVKEYASHLYGSVTRTIKNIQFYFREGITYTFISSSKFGVRYSPAGFIFDVAGSSVFVDKKIQEYILALMISKIMKAYLDMLNPTLNYQVGDIKNVPVIICDSYLKQVNALVLQNISIARTDWDSFETSWDFQVHPLVKFKMVDTYAWRDEKPTSRISSAFKAWETFAERQFATLKANEEELNRVFIEIYGLQDELTPEVEDKDVTIRKADLSRDIRSFISYAVGCMFGRYSLDEPGLQFAGGEFSEQWAVVSGQYYLKEVLREYGCAELSKTDCLAKKETTHCPLPTNHYGVGQYYLKGGLREYGCTELSGVDRMAKSNGTGERSIPAGEIAAQGRDVCSVGSDAASGGFDPVEYSGGAGKDIDERIRAVPVDSAELQGGTSNTTADMRRPRIPCRYGYKGSDRIVGGSGQNAGCPYKETAHCPLTTDHYGVDPDAVLPIGASDYFDDDIVVRFVDFVRVVYGDATLDENLNFIADALYPNGGGSAKEKIRRYFLNDFYKDHVKTYQKRPIYWLFDSGKKDGFKALIYLHRYDKFTVARVRTDYLHPLQRKYESEIGRLEMLSGITGNAREKAAYRKEIETLQKRIEECRVYDQVVAHIAHQAIELDLDDGVKVNYAKFQGVEVPKDNGKTVKMDLLAKI